MQGIFFLYIFGFIFILLINSAVWYNRFWKVYLVIILGSLLGFLISLNNLKTVENNAEIISNITVNYREKVYVKGEILEIYKQSDMSNSYILNIHNINSKIISNKINLLLNTGTKLKFEKGDIIEFNDKIGKIENFNDFEFDKYLLLKDIYGQAYIYQFIKKGNSLNRFEKYIYNTRVGFLNIISKIYPGDSAKLLAGIFLGVRGDYSKKLTNNFNNSGLSHIVAVSGYNITILIVFFGLFLRNFNPFVKNILIGIIITLFLLLIGYNIPAIRAGVMGIVGYIIMNYGRRINIYSLLIIMIYIFVLINPLILNYDVSFHLTFLALLGLISLQKNINDFLEFLPKKFQIRESISTTLSVLIFTVPIMIVNFKKISLISVISNMLALPVIPLSMLTGGLSILGYIINSKIGIFIGFFSFLVLKYILYVVETLGNFGFSTVSTDIGNYRNIFLILYFFILTFTILYFKQRNKSFN